MAWQRGDGPAMKRDVFFDGAINDDGTGKGFSNAGDSGSVRNNLVVEELSGVEKMSTSFEAWSEPSIAYSDGQSLSQLEIGIEWCWSDMISVALKCSDCWSNDHGLFRLELGLDSMIYRRFWASNLNLMVEKKLASQTSIEKGFEGQIWYGLDMVKALFKGSHKEWSEQGETKRQPRVIFFSFFL